jgi:hypothetical protein
MPSDSRLFRVALLLLMAVHAGVSSAGPVGTSEAEAMSEGVHSAPLAPSGLTTGLNTLSIPTATSAPRSAPGADEEPPTAGALAAEILKEARAGASTLESGQPSPPSATATSGSRTTSREAEDVFGLRGMSKAAVHWIQDAVPWLRDDSYEKWSERRSRAVNTAPRPTVQFIDLDDSTRGPGGANPTGYGSGDNVVRQTIKTIQEVASHPMSWLVILLFVIGGIVMSKVDRRPK